MFIKETTFKRKSGRKVTYLQLVTSVWDKEKQTPRHQVLCNLGRLDQLDKDQLQSLVDKLSSYLDEEPQVAAEDLLQLGQTYEFGIAYLVEGVWKKLRLDRFFTDELKRRKYEKPVHQAILGMVINRCQHPDSKRATDQWLSQEVYFPPAQQLQLHHYYRAMDFLLDTQNELEMALYDHYRQGKTPQMVFYDTTSSYFETIGTDEQDDALRQYGYSRDHRPDRQQILLGLAVDAEGMPLASNLFPGNTHDSTTVQAMLARLKSLGVERCVFVSDSGMVSEGNLSSLHEAGLATLVGTRMRSVEEIQQQVLSKRGRFIELESGLGVKEVLMEGYRYVVVYNPKQARKDAKVREEAVSRVESLLEQIEAGKASVCELRHPLLKRFVRTLKDGTPKLNATKVREDARYDGKYVLRTTTDLPMQDVLAAYKTLIRIEIV